MKKTILFPLVLLFIVFVISGCGPKKVNLEPIMDPSVIREIAPVVKSTETEVIEPKISETVLIAEPVMCGSDRNCFITRFLKCLPAEFKIISSAGEKNLSVIGLTGDYCYFRGGLHKDGALINSGINCRVPKNLITSNIFDHFFEQDQVTGKEDIKTEQDRIESEYCNKI